ncbi:MAG: 2-isopropylmalate synthase [Synergistaceae bacterium]|jgi:2-isopropylmalate synthase|nr:2-isopropylmalate synthase [Synergistaceae bacterium]
MAESCDIVKVFDTTLRDGEQAARINLNTGEKIQIARQLERLNVDIIEAGFPASSPGDFDAVRQVASEVRTPIIAGLARTKESDITAAGEALRTASRPRIHTFIATSPIHMEYKLKMSPDDVLREIESAVRLASSITDDVEFSAEDASRSDIDFLVEAYTLAIECGARTLNIPDTVGYAMPNEFGEFCRNIIRRAAKPGVVWSVHCHNDLGLGVANTLAAVRSGARQVECTINGLGERAGNASMEEIVMGLRTRSDHFGADTRIETTKFFSTSKLVSHLTGVPVQPNKAIVGVNAFAHEAGIHQHGILCNRATYEIMTPESVGSPGTDLHLGKHSGRHAFAERVEHLGYQLTGDQLSVAFEYFKILCDKKKDVSDGDIEAFLMDRIIQATPERRYELRDYAVTVGSGGKPTASITLSHKDQDITEAAVGNGPVDAAYKAILKILSFAPELSEFKIRATSELADALGEAHVILRYKDLKAQGRGASTDIIEATIRAYVEAVNRLYSTAAAREVTI